MRRSAKKRRALRVSGFLRVPKIWTSMAGNLYRPRRHQSAEEHVGIRVQTDGQESAADAGAHDQGASAGKLEPSPGVSPGQRAIGQHDGAAPRQRDLAAMSVPAQGELESV